MRRILRGANRAGGRWTTANKRRLVRERKCGADRFSAVAQALRRNPELGATSAFIHADQPLQPSDELHVQRQHHLQLPRGHHICS